MSWFCWFETIFWDVVSCISTSLFLASCLSKGAGCALSNSVAVDAESSSLHGIVDVTPSHSLRCCISFSTARASTALPPQSYLVESSHSSPVPASHKRHSFLHRSDTRHFRCTAVTHSSPSCTQVSSWSSKDRPDSSSLAFTFLAFEKECRQLEKPSEQRGVSATQFYAVWLLQFWWPMLTHIQASNCCLSAALS